MKKIQDFAIGRLKVEEDFGFQKMVLAERDALQNSTDSPSELSVRATVDTSALLTASLDAFATAFDEFDAALKDSASVPSTAVVAAALPWRVRNTPRHILLIIIVDPLDGRAGGVSVVAEDNRLPLADGLIQHPDFLLIGSDGERVVSGYPLRREAGAQGNHVAGEDVRPLRRMDIRDDLPGRVPIVKAQLDAGRQPCVAVQQAQAARLVHQPHVLPKIGIPLQGVRMKEILPLPSAHPVRGVRESEGKRAGGGAA